MKEGRAWPAEVTNVKKKKILLTVLDNLELAIAGVILVALVSCTFVGVFARYLFGVPFNWLEEMQQAAMVWIAFLVAGAAFRRESHVAIEIVVDSLPKKAQKIVEIFIAIVVYAVLIYFLRSSLKFLQVFLKTGRTTPMLRIPMYYIYSIAPVSAVLMMVSYAVMLVRKFILKTPEKEDEA